MHVVFSFTILVISFISDGVIPPKLSTIQNKSAMPFIFSNLSKKPSYSFHLDIYIVKEKTTCPIGFHGHNNLQLGLINTLTAIEEGVDFVDATILGMGRGAGNLNMELLLTMLSKRGLEVNFNILGDVIFSFQPLLDKYACCLLFYYFGYLFYI